MNLEICKTWLSKTFRRETVSTRFIPAIDGLRFVAIFLVFLSHLSWYILERYGDNWTTLSAGSPLIAHLRQQGHIGVQLFFVISGFVLGIPFAKGLLTTSVPRLPPIRPYILRRITRLEPPYIISLVVFFLLLTLVQHQPAASLIPHLLASILYIHGPLYGEPSTISIVAWSLEVEIQFYAIAPLLALALYRGPPLRRRAKMFCLAVLFVAFQRWLSPHGAIALSLLNHAQYFILGMLLADLWITDWVETSADLGRLGLAAIDGVGAASLITMITWDHEAAGYQWIVPVSCAGVVYSALRGNVLRRLTSRSLPVTLGGMCYTIYLYHGLLIAAMRPIGQRIIVAQSLVVSLMLQIATIGALVVVVSGILFALIERPCMDKEWPRKCLRRLGIAP